MQQMAWDPKQVDPYLSNQHLIEMPRTNITGLGNIEMEIDKV